MSEYRTLNRLVLAKNEATPGTDAAPDLTNAVLVEAPQTTPNLESEQTNEVTGELDVRGRIPSRASRSFNTTAYLKGSGAAGTTAPEWSPLLRACAIAVVARAAALTGTAQAGASGSITLAASASGVNVGEVITTTGGTGSGQTRVVTAWNNTTKVASVFPNWAVTPDSTTTYSIPANHLYRKTSTALEAATIYSYLHRSDGASSKLDKMIGAAGNCQIEIGTGRAGRMNFTFSGQLTTPEDVANPGTATYQTTRPVPFVGAAGCYLGQAQVKNNTFTLDLGNQVQLADNPMQEFGYDLAAITRREMTGRINPPVGLQSARDAIASWRDQTSLPFWLAYGKVAGNRQSVYVPSMIFSGTESEDINGFAHEGLPFSAPDGFHLCMY